MRRFRDALDSRDVTLILGTNETTTVETAVAMIGKSNAKVFASPSEQ
jgi:hypothetical protein